MIFYGYGDRSFTLLKSYATGSDFYPFSFPICDFNNDNHLDIVLDVFKKQAINCNILFAQCKI